MTDQEDNINLGKLVFDDNNQEKKLWACFGQTCSISLYVFLSQIFMILLITKLLNKLITMKNRVFITLVGPSETRKSKFFYSWLKIGTFQTKVVKIDFFINIYSHFTM